MKYAILPVTPFQQNCSFLKCETTDKVAIVDPGGDLDKILEGEHLVKDMPFYMIKLMKKDLYH